MSDKIIQVLAKHGYDQQKDLFIHQFLKEIQEIGIEQSAILNLQTVLRKRDYEYLIYDLMQLEPETVNLKETPQFNAILIGSKGSGKTTLYNFCQKVCPKIKLIDTEGLGLSLEEDLNICAQIIQNISQLRELTAIILVFNGTESRWHESLQYIISLIIDLISVNFLERVFLVLTNVSIIQNLPVLQNPKIQNSIAMDLQKEPKQESDQLYKINFQKNQIKCEKIFLEFCHKIQKDYIPIPVDEYITLLQLSQLQQPQSEVIARPQIQQQPEQQGIWRRFLYCLVRLMSCKRNLPEQQQLQEQQQPQQISYDSDKQKLLTQIQRDFPNINQNIIKQLKQQN